MSTNKFPAICNKCKGAIPAGHGILIAENGSYKITHKEDQCKQTAGILCGGWYLDAVGEDYSESEFMPDIGHR